MKTFSITDIGMKRSMNQDSVYCEENAIGSFPNLFIVADGMGGHKAGDRASRLCVDTIVDAIKMSKLKTPISTFEEAIQKANESILKAAVETAEYEGMGTTLVAAVALGHTLYVANVGDSRLYLLRDTLDQITEDHSLVEEMYKSGEITRDGARVHPNKNVITRAIGIYSKVVVDYFELELSEGDIILLCSDGLTNMLDDKEIQEIIQAYPGDPEAAGKELIARANLAGGKDNISAVLVQL